MVTKKTYTNADIIKRFDAQDKRLDDMSSEIVILKDWKMTQDIGKAAVDEYRRQEAKDRDEKNKSTIYNSVKDLLPYITLLLAGVTAIIYAYASRTH